MPPSLGVSLPVRQPSSPFPVRCPQAFAFPPLYFPQVGKQYQNVEESTK